MGWKAAEKLIRHWKILRGDNVMIIRGKDKGETGIIKRVIRSQNRVIVEGKNLVKKHIKQGPGHEGGIFTVEAPLHASNVQVLDPVTGKPCKVGVKYLEDGTKVRVSRGIGASGSIIPRPEILKIRTTPRPTLVPRILQWILCCRRHTILKPGWACLTFKEPCSISFEAPNIWGKGAIEIWSMVQGHLPIINNTLDQGLLLAFNLVGRSCN
ncbi:50S ribosomal protein L24, chloroplastic [Gossypium australe]|uniref:50S ribosomal protein L24, chloroplastic n=1 Tax=Gossypium australe TaxID=47621 RepID=A0A5B6V261_9ROSI|nr:50S ribosomal protein L24, chloroplastic [Gossypium australe]